MWFLLSSWGTSRLPFGLPQLRFCLSNYVLYRIKTSRESDLIIDQLRSLWPLFHYRWRVCVIFFFGRFPQCPAVSWSQRQRELWTMGQGEGTGTGEGGIGWSIMWLIILLFVGFWLASLCAFLYIIVSVFAACCEGLNVSPPHPFFVKIFS